MLIKRYKIVCLVCSILFASFVSASAETTQQYQNTLDKNIPDNSSTGATRELLINDAAVSNAAIITNTAFGTLIDHTYPSNLKVTLTSPSGTTLTIWNNAGGSTDGGEDDDAADDDDIHLGRTTSVFNGERIKGGSWVVKAVDSVPSDTGTIRQIALQFSYSVPTVSSVTPSTGTVGQVQNYTVNGSNLPSTLAFTIADADGCNQVSYSSTRTVFSCTPQAAGSKQYIVKDYSGGTSLKYGTINVSSAAPTVSSVTPSTGTVGQVQNYTVNGSNLPSTLAFTIADADGCNQVSYSSTRTVFRCTPQAAGSKQYIVKDYSGGTSLKYGTINVSSATPTVSSVSHTPNPPIVNQPITFIAQTDIAAGQMQFQFTGLAKHSMTASNGNQTWEYSRPEGLADTNPKTYSLYVNGASSSSYTGTVQAIAPTPIVASGYPQASPSAVKIGEPVVFELRTTRAVDRVEINMGGGDGFQPMYAEQGDTIWRLTRHVGFALSGTKNIYFNVYDPGNQLLTPSPATVNVTVSSSIYQPPYTRGAPESQAVPSSHGVALLNGNLYRQFTDITAPNRKLNFMLTRSFNNLDKKLEEWRFNYFQKIKGTENAAYIENADGSNQWHYKSSVDGLWYAHSRSFDILRQQGDGSFDLYTKSNLHYHFDSLNNGGKLRSVSDRDGNSFTLYYDANNHLDYMRDNQSRNYDFNIDTSGKLLRVTDFTGRYVEYTWVNDNLSAVKDVRGYTTQYHYDLRGNLTRITDPRGNSIQYTYDSQNNRVESFTDENGFQTSYTYGIKNGTPETIVHLPASIGANAEVGYWFDIWGRLQEISNARNYKSSSLYKNLTDSTKIAESLLVTQATTPRGYEEGYQTEFNYSSDGRGNKILVQDPDGLETNLEWHQAPIRPSDENLTNQNLLKKYTPPGIGSAHYSFTYTTTGHVSRSTDPLGRFVDKTYNSSGQVTQSTDAMQNSTSFTYDSNGFLSHVTDPENNQIVYSHDALGRTTAVRDKRGNTTRYTYDAAGNVRTETDPMNGITEHEYDQNGNLIKTVDPKGNITHHTYDNRNQLQTTQVTVGGTTYTQSYSYDALGRMTSTTNRNNRTSQTTYDYVGNVLSRIDPLTHTVSYTYNRNNRIETATDQEGRTVAYTYDKQDRVIEIKDDQNHTQKTTYNNQGLVASREDERGNITRYEYDVAGQLTKVTDPNGGITRTTYDANGNQATITDPNNHTTTHIYDALNQLVELRDHAGHRWRYTYDENGNQTRELKPDNSYIDIEYDANNRVSRRREYGTTGSLIRSLTYTYDANGNTTSISNGTSSLSYTYDELNRIKTATDHYGKIIGYQYDGVGNLTRLTYPGNKIVQYSYDTADRLQQVTDWLNNSTTYTRNNAGQITLETLGNGAIVTKTYDTVGRLVSLNNLTADDDIISSHQMTLDEGGNIIRSIVDLPLQPELPPSSAMTYDSTNRILQGAGVTYTHDPNGRIIEQHENGDVLVYNFNSQDLISSIVNNGSTQAQYVYDVNDDRVSRTINGVETRFVVDSNTGLSRVLAETDNTGIIQRYYIYGDGLLSQIDSSNNVKFYHFDPTGHTLALTNDSGNVTDKYAFSPFGKTSIDGSTHNPFLYVGRYGVMDDGNGLHYMRARYYREDIKRFLSLDVLHGELFNPQSLNRYAYVLGNPIMGIDPSGLLFEYGSKSQKFVSKIELFGKHWIKASKTVMKEIPEDILDVYLVEPAQGAINACTKDIENETDIRMKALGCVSVSTSSVLGGGLDIINPINIINVALRTPIREIADGDQAFEQELQNAASLVIGLAQIRKLGKNIKGARKRLVGAKIATRNIMKKVSKRGLAANTSNYNYNAKKYHAYLRKAISLAEKVIESFSKKNTTSE